MTARAARDDDLDVRFLAEFFRVVIAVVAAAELAACRGRTFGTLLVHTPRLTRRGLAALPRRPALGPPSKAEPSMSAVRAVAAALVALLVAAPVLAARPIVDLHKFDAYFALYAADSNVPWKTTTVRLDTYSSAPVQISVYQVDPADVLTAGSNARPRAIVTRNRRPVARFTFTPPGGYQFQPNEIALPLGHREGFFVVEARRGAVGEQVWINRTRVGLVTKQTPAQLSLYGVDLGTGRALSGMRVQLLVGDRFVTEYTNGDGVVRWESQPRPIFALARWGASFAFASPLPEPPLPQTIVGVRTDSAVVRAGGVLRVVGFARTLAGSVLRPASGEADVSLRDGAVLLAQRRVPVDRAGAFFTDFDVPADADTGDDAVIAQVDGGVGSATERVDANAGGLSLSVASACADACDPRDEVPLIVRSSRPHVDVRVTVVRSPHVYVDYSDPETPWGTTMWLDEHLTTGDDGRVDVRIPHPTDGLASTYGVRVQSGGATAGTRVIVPTAPFALRLHLDRTTQSLGMPVRFDVYANYVRDAKPLQDARVDVTLTHGAFEQRASLVLDHDGHARGSFSSADLGTSLVIATVSDDGAMAEDAGQVQVVPQASLDPTESISTDVTLTLDRERYRPGDIVHVKASAPGAHGEALLTLESERGIQVDVVPVRDGSAAGALRAVDAVGALAIGAVFVRDGATLVATAPLDVDGAGRAALADVSIDGEVHPGSDVALQLRDVYSSPGTVVMRLSDGEPSGSALFDAATEILSPDVNTTQTSAPEGVTWHPWVDSTGAHPLVLEFVRRTEPPQELQLAQSDIRDVSWSVESVDGDTMRLQLPELSGRYTLSVLDITDDGRVIAASSILDLP
jgi:hypothetical protein